MLGNVGAVIAVMVRAAAEVGWEMGVLTLGLNGGYIMAIAPTNKREADAMALKLFCLLAFLLVGLITAGVL